MVVSRAEIRAWAWCALVSNVLFVLSWLVAAAWQGPRYSVVRHTISDMYAQTAPHGAVLAAVLAVCGAAVVLFALRSVWPVLLRGGWTAAAGSALLAVSILGLGDLLSPFEREGCRLADPGLHPADQVSTSGGALDSILSAVGLICLVAAGFFLAEAMQRTPGWQDWARPARWAAIVVIVLTVLTVLLADAGVQGLFERLLAAAAAAAVAALAWGVLSVDAPAVPAPSGLDGRRPGRRGMSTLAVTGATGYVGGRVAHLLGTSVRRLIVRDAARAPRVDGDPEVMQAAYGEPDASARALAGVEVLLMVSAAESPTRREEHRAFVAAAAQAGVRHVVYTSFCGAAPDAVFTLGRDHWDTEQAIRASGMRFTFLRDNLYADFLPLLCGEDGVIRGPAADGRVAAVARADVADVAAAVLRDVLADPAAHDGAAYALTGPEAPTLTEAARRMTAALGRPFAYAEQTLQEAYAQRRPLSTQQWQLDAWVSTYVAIADGSLGAVSPDVERVTGRPARTLEQALLGD